ncbi:hypothetical protein EVJ58_g7272 [Rhodofomes roseus]|uniref:J domain-containing protein n=1 Tax=Rhodofomes roseus TaxID=34475 RepID=A0A4Y9Y3I1_9APHY|nr:hypothetical protein EVJ58_g7272 [Rhodofomes roseus]
MLPFTVLYEARERVNTLRSQSGRAVWPESMPVSLEELCDVDCRSQRASLSHLRPPSQCYAASQVAAQRPDVCVPLVSLSRTQACFQQCKPFPISDEHTPYASPDLPPPAQCNERRDYDLVRIYHPDSAISRAVPPDTAHARFQAISAAYSVLTGKARRMGDVESDSASELRPDYNSLSTAMWKAKQRRRAELNVGTDDRWKDALMFGAITLSVAAFVWQAHSARQQAIAAAQNAPDWSQSWRTRKNNRETSSKTCAGRF